MKYEFVKNGEVKLTLKPEDNLEQEFFKLIFTGGVDVTVSASANHNGEVIIKAKKPPAFSTLTRSGGSSAITHD